MNDNQHPKINQRSRSMDMVGGHHARRMSPEMEAAQARLKHKQDDSLPPRPRLRPEYGPMTSNRRMSQVGIGGAPKRPLSAPQRQNTHASRASIRTGVSPSGRSSFAELETVEFNNLKEIASMDTSEELANSFTEEPKPLVPDEPKENPDAVLRGFEELTAEDLKEGKGPDNNQYALGGKSPFINTLNLEKRPLSGHSVAKKSASAKAPEPRLTTSDAIPTVVASKRKNKKNNIALVIAIILTVIFGAVVGTFVYLAFFQ